MTTTAKSNPPINEATTQQIITNYQTSNTKSEFTKTIDKGNMTQKILGFPKEIDNFTYHNACGKDERTFRDMFWAIYKHQEDLTKICFPERKYELMSISIDYYILNLCLLLMMNGIFFTNKQFTSRYHKGELSFGEDLLRAIPSNIITAIICAVIKALMSYSTKIETIIAEIKTEEINDKIQKYYGIINIKFIIFHSILFVLLIFNFYYLS